LHVPRHIDPMQVGPAQVGARVCCHDHHSAQERVAKRSWMLHAGAGGAPKPDSPSSPPTQSRQHVPVPVLERLQGDTHGPFEARVVIVVCEVTMDL
jgi:hypothetical protein